MNRTIFQGCLLCGLMALSSLNALAISFYPESILTNTTTNPVPVLMTPPLKIGDSLYVGLGSSVNQITYRIQNPSSASLAVTQHLGFDGKNQDFSNYVVANGRIYVANATRFPAHGNAIFRQSFISFSVIDDAGIPQTPNTSIGSVLLKDKFYLPTGSLAADASGNLYVADRSDAAGAAGSGVIWKIVPVAGSSDHTAEVFHNFNGQSIDEGNTTSALLAQGEYLYGLNRVGGINNKGTLFRKKLDGTGSLNILHTFNLEGIPDGDTFYARSALLLEGDWLYGTVTDWANATGHGVVFRVKPDGSDFSVLHSFTGQDTNGINHDGSKPSGPLAIKDEWIYGTTLKGGENNVGAIYRINKVDGIYEAVGSFGNQYDKPLGLIYDSATDMIYGSTSGAHGVIQNAPGVSVFKLLEEKSFEISLTASRTDVELGKQELLLNWSVQAAPTDAVCAATSDPLNADWDNPSLVLEDDNGKKKGSGTTPDLAGVNSRMQATQANIFTLACASASDSTNSKTVSITVNAREPNPLSVTFTANPNSTGEKANLYWNVTAPGNAGGECRGTSDPAGYWSGTYAFGTDSQQLDVPTANGRTGKHTYTFTLVCERNEKDLRNTESNSVTKTASLEFDFGPGSGGTSSAASSANTSSAVSSSSVSSAAAISSSVGSSVASGPQGSGGGGAMNLWWMLSLCLLALGRRVNV